MVTYMTERYGTIAANINGRTAPMWDQFRAQVQAAGMTNTSALTQAARLWLAEMEKQPRTARVDPFAGNAPQPAAEPPPVITDTYVPPPVNPFA